MLDTVTNHTNTLCVGLLLILQFSYNSKEADSLTICDSDLLCQFYAGHCPLSVVYYM